MKPKFAALFPAGGQSLRMGSLCPNGSKLFIEIAQGLSFAELSLRSIVSCQGLGEVVLACRQEQRGLFADLLSRLLDAHSIKWQIVCGGDSRQASVYACLSALTDTSPDLVLVHDVARPFCHTNEVLNVVEEAHKVGAAILACPVQSTLKRAVSVSDSSIESTLSRDRVWEAMTPQVFRRSILIDAHTKAKTDSYIGTDEAELVERLGVRVSLVQGSRENIKITSPNDIELARAIWMMRLRMVSPRGFEPLLPG